MHNFEATCELTKLCADAVQFSDLTIHRMVSYKNQDLEVSYKNQDLERERETERCMMIQFHARSSQTKQLPVLSRVRDVGARFLVLRRRSARQLDFRAGAAISMRKIAADDVFPGVGGMERYGKWI